jgi:FAD/FMN-containing dehydrogenase/Fe-S oxidoreductase
MIDTPLEKQLRKDIEGEIHFDSLHKKIYSVDASIYEIEPLGIVIPKNKHALRKALQIASENNVPIIARGAATGIAGGCIGKGLIIDTSKYLNKILKVDLDREIALCEPGVVQDQLNIALRKSGYRLGPDTSTGNRATLGGMLGNNAAGAHSLRYGSMSDHVEAVDFLLSGGEMLRCSASLTLEQWHAKLLQNNREGQIYRALQAIHKKYHKSIASQFPRLPRCSSGYDLKSLTSENPPNICRLITGSEGTLGIAAEITVKICRTLKVLGLCILSLPNMIEGLASIPEILTYSPLSLEMIDRSIFRLGRLAPSVSDKLEWLEGDPEALFIVEFEGDSSRDVAQKIALFSREMEMRKIGFSQKTVVDPTVMSHVWEVRKSGLGLLLSQRSYRRAIAFLEDIAVPPDQLASFIQSYKNLLAKAGFDHVGIYGHAGAGCMHIRPYVDLRNAEQTRKIEPLMRETAELILAHKGVLSGEHGDGLARSWLNKKMFGDELYNAFQEIKYAFDPHNQMNPGKIVHGPPIDENWRLSPDTPIKKINTFLDFSAEGGIELAADLCNGNGSCRKAEGVMCPSFQATGDEFDSTRARAQALRSLIHDRLPMEQFASHEIRHVLDLCLECKGCKSECPSEVDMAKMKAEFLYHYHTVHGTSLRDRLFSSMGRINQMGSLFPALYNLLLQSHLSKFLLQRLGIARERKLPSLAQERLSSWSVRTQPIRLESEQQVVLLSDTFSEFHQPHIGQAAVKVLEALGYQVLIPRWYCCGRPAFSKGLLMQAQQMAQRLITHLAPYAEKNLPIIGLEPSCLLMITEDYKGLLPNHSAYKKVAACSILFDAFIEKHLDRLSVRMKNSEEHLLLQVHGHCHQKALVGMQATLNILRSLPNSSLEMIASGCCGMAGSFGYEEEHYALSQKIGELHLFPALEKNTPETCVIADGFSCRGQILQGTQRTALHLAELLAQRL